MTRAWIFFSYKNQNVYIFLDKIFVNSHKIFDENKYTTLTLKAKKSLSRKFLNHIAFFTRTSFCNFINVHWCYQGNQKNSLFWRIHRKLFKILWIIIISLFIKNHLSYLSVKILYALAYISFIRLQALLNSPLFHILEEMMCIKHFSMLN